MNMRNSLENMGRMRLVPTRRVALLSEHASPAALLGGQDAGGQNVYVDEVSRHLARLGCTVDVFTRRDNPNAPEFEQWGAGVRIVNVSAGPAEFIVKDRLWPLMPDFLAGVERVMLAQAEHGQPYDVIHGNFWMSGWVATELGRRHHIPVAQIFHAMGLTKRRHQGDADTSPAERIEVERGIVKAANRLIAQCPAERNELVDDYDADPGKVVVIPSAVNISQFHPVERDEARRRIGLTTDGPVIVYVGRMLPRKDVRNIVSALALLVGSTRDDTPRNVTLMLVGGETTDPDPVATPEIGELQRLAEGLGVSKRIWFVGKRQPDELRDYYSAGDVVVTTPWYEPFGLTPLEGMACGRPVIGSAVGGVTYTIADGATGLLVPPRDPRALAAALRELLNNPQRRHEMGQAARARVERDFTWATVARRTAALYETLVAEANVSGTPPDADGWSLAGLAQVGEAR